MIGSPLRMQVPVFGLVALTPLRAFAMASFAADQAPVDQPIIVTAPRLAIGSTWNEPGAYGVELGAKF